MSTAPPEPQEDVPMPHPAPQNPVIPVEPPASPGSRNLTDQATGHPDEVLREAMALSKDPAGRVQIAEDPQLMGTMLRILEEATGVVSAGAVHRPDEESGEALEESHVAEVLARVIQACRVLRNA